MNKHIYVSIVIIAMPLALLLLGQSSFEAISNVGQLGELLFLSPGLVAEDQLFGFQKDIGLIPTNLGRVLVTMFYLLVYWGFTYLFKKVARNSSVHS